MTERTYFEMSLEAIAFEKTVMTVVSNARSNKMAESIPEENSERFSHGRRWSHPANPRASVGELEKLSVGWELSFEDIVGGDLEMVGKSIDQLSARFYDEQMRTMYRVMSEVCETNGQVVSASETGSLASAFMETIRKIEFGVDRDGKVSMPQIHMGPELAEKFRAELDAQSQEFKDEIERIKAEKVRSAIAKDEARRARFKKGAAE